MVGSVRGFTLNLAEFNVGNFHEDFDYGVIKRVVYHRAYHDALDLADSPENIDYEKKKMSAQIIKVKNKEGEEKAIIFDPDKEARYGKIIEEIANHETCRDLFRDILDYMDVD